MKKIKILMPVAWYYPIGGVEAYVLELSKALSDKFEIVWAIKYLGQKSKVSIENVKIVECGRILEVKEIIQKEKPDIIFSNNTEYHDLYFSFYAKKFQIPFIYTLHRISVNPVSIFPFNLIYNIYSEHIWWFYIWLIVKNSFVTIAPSCFVRDKLVKKLGINNVEVIYNGVPDRFKPLDEQEKTKLKEKYGFKGKNVILWVGRLDWLKNPAMFVEAAKSDKDSNNQYVLVGFDSFGKEYQKVKDSIGRLMNISMFDFIDYEKIDEIYKMSDAFVSTSRFETLGNTILEAKACGMTVIAPNHSGAKEAGEGGYIYEYNQTELEETIQKAIKKPIHLSKLSTMTEVSKKYREIFNKLKK